MRYSIYYCVLLFAACTSYSKDYEYILRKAGSNKFQLSKVLAHYSQRSDDSLKFKAAVFLIENMSEKLSYYGEDLDRFYKFCDSISHNNITQSQYRNAINQYYSNHGTLVGNLKIRKDIETISFDYMIANIDDAFEVFNKQQWKYKIDFNTFCEYVLPYKTGTETIEFFRKDMYSKFKFPNVFLSDMIGTANAILSQTSKSPMLLTQYPDFVPDFPVSHLQKIKAGACTESSSYAIYIMRSFGIPAAIDFTPQWAHRASGHSWCALLIDDDTCIDFEGVNAPRVGGHILLSSSNRLAKVYRQTFSRQENSLAAIHGNEEIPALFLNPYFKDVSEQYYKGANLTLNFSPDMLGNKRFVYLCVFDNANWKPVAWAEVNNHVAVFNGLGRNAVYLPAKYENGQVYGISDPVLIDSAGIPRAITPDSNRKSSITVKRKYPILDWWDSRTLAMKGGQFQVSNDSTFKDALDIYEINEPPKMKYHDVKVNLSGKFRYVRYLASDSSYGDIAELNIYNDKVELSGNAYSSQPEDPANSVDKVFDNNALTYFHGVSTEKKNWVTIDFGTPKTIKRLRYLGRNDDNFINQTDIYELFYWSQGNWQSLGRKSDTRNRQALKYENVPINALLLLKDHSKGKEERIFTFENNKQVWW